MYFRGWKFHGCGFKVGKDLVNDINYILIYCGFKMIFEFQVIFLARLFVNGIVIFGVVVSNPIVMIIVFNNYTTLCNLVQGSNFSNNWTIPNVWMKHFEKFHDMLINNALCCNGVIALWPFWS